MPFRERVKKAFGRSGSISTDGSSLKLNKTNTNKSEKPPAPDPKPKYRGPVDPKHKERLESFSFVHNFRRKSQQSQYSPFGSRLPSRNNSLGADPRKLFNRGPSQVTKVMENPDDFGDVANVGGTRNHSATDPSISTAPTDSTVDPTEHEDTQGGAQEPRGGYAHDHTPFTEADVAKGLEKISSKRSAS